MTASRGLQNNNPGNIVKGAKWLGLAESQPDKRFCTFTEMKYGCRALLKLVRTYYLKYHLNTVAKIINRWAPPNENDTQAYISFVAKSLGVGNTQAIDLINDPDKLIALSKAISVRENGNEAKTVISDAIWQEAYKLI